ncbi:MAG: tetratricopeptide repeat protein, partial [Bacteroidota bacterium]
MRTPAVLCLLFWLLPSVLLCQDQSLVQIQALMEACNDAYMAGDYALSLQKVNAAEALSDRSNTYPLDKKANLYRSKAHVFMAMGDLKEGVEYTRRSLSAFRQSIGPAERLTADLQYELGFFFDRLFQYDSAIYHYEGCIDLYKQAIGDSTDDIPLTYNQLANIYLALGLPEAAESYATEAYRLWIRNFGLKSRRGITASRLLSRL